MADKISILVLDVDLECHTCYKKIKKAVCKCSEIKGQVFDEKQNKVILSGPFDPEKLIKKLYCKVGCKIIKGYEIKKPEDKPKPKPAPPPPEPEPPKPAPPPPPPPEPEPPKPAPPPPPPPEPEPPKPAPPPPPPPEPEPPKPAPPPPEPEPPKPAPPPPVPPKPAPPEPEPVLVVPVGPRVCCIECYEGHDDGYCRRGGYHRPVCCRECYDGRDDGYCRRVGGPQYYSGCRYFSEEDSTCTIM